VGYQETANKALIEYGLQTLKWSFLLNAGAIAVVMAYIGACAKSGPIASYAPLIGALWPFAAGCFCVVLAGVASFFNFESAIGLLPTAEALNNFLPLG
jgi:hypothetical protein